MAVHPKAFDSRKLIFCNTATSLPSPETNALSAEDVALARFLTLPSILFLELPMQKFSPAMCACLLVIGFAFALDLTAFAE